MHTEASIAIINYMEQSLFEPKSDWPENEFARRSYSIWAANEILWRIMDHPFDSAISLIEGFFLQMLYYSHIARNETASLAFSTAMNIAEDIMLLLA